MFRRGAPLCAKAARPVQRRPLGPGTALGLALACAAGLALSGRWRPQGFAQVGGGLTAAGRGLSLPALEEATTAPRAAVARRAFTTAPIAEPPEDLMSIKQRKFTPSAEHLEYAVVEYSGRQHMVTEGSMYETYFIRAVPGAKVRFNRVMLLKHKNKETGEFEVSIGQPLIDGAYVEVTILEHLKSDDQIIYKHKRKKHYQRRYIVQQKLTRFRIDKIVMGNGETEIVGKRPFPLWDERPTEA
uniref:Uncharacterized protein n=1 Tax=Pyrodinium bahamense TaxID=73915 RepID=A0A7S0AER4_9DINO|mmetsp:Transcript_32913/g.90898  ORF Transcript_32913/g.90898 Transcript_32913/m.90898 type:complete len:243 (+) Transcript_32913:99-827(+)